MPSQRDELPRSDSKMISLATARRLHKTQELLPQFRVCEGTEGLSQFAGDNNPLGKLEQLLGTYENRPRSKEGVVLVTDRGLHWWTAGTWQSLGYSKMVSVEWSPKAKLEARELLIETDAGNVVRVPIAGGTKVTRDVFSFMTLIMGMIEEVNAKPCPYCGKSLMSARAKQCPHCFMDWHDPGHPRSLKGAQQNPASPPRWISLR